MEVTQLEQKKWHEALEKQKVKIKKKDLKKNLGHKVRKSFIHPDGDFTLLATNFWGNNVTIKCKTEEECYQNLAVLNGVTIK